MNQKSYTTRIRITKNGKLMRRKMGVGHFRAKKGSAKKQDLKKGSAISQSDMRSIWSRMSV